MQNPNKNSLKSAPFNAFLISDSLSAIGYIGGRLPERSKKCGCDAIHIFAIVPLIIFVSRKQESKRKTKFMCVMST